jgi:transcriptional regulator with XRE-family HTH domain
MWVFSGDLLSAAMEAEDLGTVEVAHRTGVSYSMINMIRSGRRRPSILTAGRLAAAVRRHPSELFVQVDGDSDDRPSELGSAMDAWVEQMLRAAPQLSQEQAERVSQALFAQVAP